MTTCRVCHKEVLSTLTGKSDVLFVTDRAEEKDIRSGYPMQDEGGIILRHELSREGVDMWVHSHALMNRHTGSSTRECMDEDIKQLTIEMAGRKVLLMGSELCKYFTGKPVTSLAGLKVESPYFPKSVQFVMISSAPRMCLHMSPGEVRLAIQKFCKAIKEDTNG